MNRLELLKSRHSVRSFSEEEIPKVILNKLKAEITMTNTHQEGLKFQLLTDDPNPMKGFSRSYGIFRNPKNYLAAVIDPSYANAYERAGYFAEKFVIRAVELGLGTCFVGGTYNASEVAVQMRAGEKLIFLVLFGYKAEKTRLLDGLMTKAVHMRHKSTADFFRPKDRFEEAVKMIPSLKEGLEAVACAPSSMNKQPVEISLSGVEVEGIKSFVPTAQVAEGNPKLLIDLGIAKFNFNFATSTECEWGNGSPLVMADPAE